eukprot:59291-Prorocentrum_lima.AAC.1
MNAEAGRRNSDRTCTHSAVDELCGWNNKGGKNNYHSLFVPGMRGPWSGQAPDGRQMPGWARG